MLSRVVVGAVDPCRVVEDDRGVGDFFVDQGIGVLCHGVKSKSIVVWVVSEIDACLFAEYVSGLCDAWAVTKDVVCVVWALTAHVAGVWVVRRASGWDI